MIIKKWTFEKIAIVLLLIFVVSGLLVVRNSVLNASKRGNKPAEELAGERVIELGVILVRPCPACLKGTITVTDNVVSCRSCEYEKNWDEEFGL